MSPQKPLISIGTELTLGTVTAIKRNGVVVESNGVKTQLTFEEAENAVRPVSQA
jgi:hypothetical protein